jgi:hypothetical protein
MYCHLPPGTTTLRQGTHPLIARASAPFDPPAINLPESNCTGEPQICYGGHLNFLPATRVAALTDLYGIGEVASRMLIAWDMDRVRPARTLDPAFSAPAKSDIATVILAFSPLKNRVFDIKNAAFAALPGSGQCSL